MYSQHSSESAGKVKKIDPKKASSNLKDRFLGRLIQSNLTEAQMDEYQSQYFPSSKLDKTLGKAPAAAFYELSHYLVRIQFALDAVHCFVRDVCTNATALTVDSRIGQNTTAKSLKAKYEEALTLFPPLNESRHESYRVLGAAMSNVGWCVIKPSERFAGGKTIVNVPYDCGKTLEGKISGSVTGFRVAMLNKKNKGWFPILHTKEYPSVMTKSYVREATGEEQDAAYKAHLDDMAMSQHMAMYGLPISASLIAVLNSIHEELSGSKMVAGNLKSKVATKPLEFDFFKYDQMIKDAHPALAAAIPEGGFFGWILKPDLGNLPNIMQFGFRLQPNTSIAAMLNKANPENQDSREDRVPRVARRTLAAMSDEFVSVSSQLMVGWTLDIKPEFVTYMCQGHDDKAETIIQNWMRIWIPSYFRQPRANLRPKAESDSENIPRTGGLPSDISRVRAVRGEFGFANRDSVGDVNGVAISEDGTMYVPAAYSDVDTEEVKAMETELNSALTKAASAGIPHSSLTLLPHQYIADMSDDGTYDRSKYKDLTTTFSQMESKYTNALAISDPSFVLCTETSASDPYDLSAQFDDAKPAEDIEVADVLGFDFSKPGQEPLKRTAYSLINAMNPSGGSSRIFRAIDNKALSGMDTVSGNTATHALVMSTLQQKMSPSLHRALGQGHSIESSSYPYMSILFDTVSKFARAYELMAMEGIVPNVQDLVPKALARVKEIMPEHEGNTVTGSWLDEGKYADYINGNTVESNVSQASVILGTFTEALADSTCLQTSTSNLAKHISAESGSNASTAVYESPYFINASDINQSLSSLRNLMSYFGGSLLVEAADAMTSADHKAIFNITRRSDSQLKFGNKLSSKVLQNFVLPFAAIVGRYLPNVEDFFERAEEYVESITPVSELDPNEITLPGSKGFSFLPHQFDAQKHLIKRPKYAVLDIAPGGGKTILGITDIMHCSAQSGKRIRPVIIAPNGLVKNWCNDLKIATDSWNIIPITTDTMKRWEPDALVELITNASRNTIVVLSNSFLSNHHQGVKLNIAGANCRISSSVEFAVRMGFNYVMLDESHKAKNPDSQINRSLRRVFCAPSVEYKRIATGTLIVDKITDIVGQAALLTPALFGKGAAINPKLSVVEMAATEKLEKADEVAKTIASVRARIESYSVLITKRKKDWAFILPYPIDNFIPIPLSHPDAPDSDLHAEAYDLVRQSLQGEIEIEMRKSKPVNTDDDDDDEDADDDEEGSGEAEIQLIRDIQSNAFLRAKYDSMEMMVTAPACHTIATRVFEAAGKDISKFIPYKLRKMGELIKNHFETEKYDPDVWDDLAQKRHRKFEWVKGCKPFELDLCMYKGRMYMARKKDKDSFTRMRLPPSEIAPDQDTEYWKPERNGKIIIICRYHTSIDAVVAAMPKEYRKNVLRFHGKRPPALNVEALERFDKDDNATIIVAMEQSISEGYNMQAGSRMIRIDNPWNSGAYEQTISRIMRPDMKSLTLDGGKPGDMAREVVNVDWLMTDGTVEVMKVALLQQKTVETEMFYEKDNPRYAPMKDYLDLAQVDFDAGTLFENRFCWYGNYSTANVEGEDEYDRTMRHFEARAVLTGIQQKEFAEMRKDKPTSLVAIPAVAAPADFKVLRNLPVVPGQKPTNDAKNYGLIQFADWYASFDWPDNKDQLNDQIKGTFVVTEYGNGRIVSTSQLSWVVDPITHTKVLKDGVPFANITVVVGKGRDARTVEVPTAIVFVAANIDKRTANAFLLDQPSVKAGKDSDKVDYEDDGSEVEVDADTKSTRPSKGEAAAAAQAKAEREAKVKAQVEADNEGQSDTARETTKVKKEIKDATAGGRRPKPSELPDIKPVSREVGELPDIKPVTRPEGKRPPKDTQAAPALDNKVDVRPMVYNGMIALYVNAAEGIDEGALKTDGFLKFGEFMYCDVRNAQDYFKVVDHFENVKKEGDESHEFVLDSASEARLNHIQYAFEHKGTMKFNYMQAYAKRKDLIEFFQVQHRQVRATAADTHLKVYPAFLGDRVRLMVDLRTCPAAKRLLNVHYDGVPSPYGKWFKHQPMFVNLVSTVAQAKAALNKLSKLGLEVNDMPSVLKMLAKIQVKPQ